MTGARKGSVPWAADRYRHGLELLQREGPGRARAIEEAIAAFHDSLSVFNREQFAQPWAVAHSNLGIALSERRERDHDDNLEEAIAAYEAALEVLTRDGDPADWAGTQNNLAGAYLERKRGNLSDNLERALQACQAATTLIDRGASPADWAKVQDQLGQIYEARRQGDRAENLEQAIKAWRNVISVRGPAESLGTLVALANTYLNRRRGAKIENVEEAIRLCQLALTAAPRAKDPMNWGTIQTVLAQAYIDRPGGDRADNLEQAIGCYQAVVGIYSRKANPLGWAMAQQGLCFAYQHRRLDGHARNVELAMAAGTAALEVYTHETYPTDWATTQAYLSVAYTDRVYGDPASNVDNSIESAQAALTVFTSEPDFAERRASVLSTRCLAYAKRPSGDRATNLEIAIQSAEEALTLVSRETSPFEWARAQAYLGHAYLHRVREDRLENLERSVLLLQSALDVLNKDMSPYFWAVAKTSLGSALSERMRGVRADNLEAALGAYEDALTVETRERSPWQWATLQLNLAATLYLRVRGDRNENLERALNACQAGLSVHTRDAAPDQWGELQNALSAVLSVRIQGDRAANRDRAVEAVEASLTIGNRQRNPYTWAGWQRNLGIAYSDRINGDRPANLDRAIEAYKGAKEVFTPERFPRDSRSVANDLADVYIERRQWDSAFAVLTDAVNAADGCYATALTEEARTAEVETNSEIYQKLVETSLNLDPPRVQRAFLTAEEARSRLLRDQVGVLLLPAPPAIPLSEIEQEAKLLRTLNNAQNAVRVVSDDSSRERLVMEAAEARGQLRVLWDHFQADYGAGDYVTIRRGARLEWGDLQAWLASQSTEVAIVEFFTLDRGFVAFVVRPEQAEPRWVRIEISAARLTDYITRFNREVTRYDVEHSETETWSGLAEFLIAPLMEYLKGASLVYLVPHGALHGLPLHALTVSGKRLFEQFAIVYAPSVAVAVRVAHHSAVLAGGLSDDHTQAVVVGDPMGDLPYAAEEARSVAQSFGVRPLLREEATKERVMPELAGRTAGHLATHASFIPTDPFSSGITLANRELLTAREVLAGALGTRLIVLSACQTGVEQVRRGDELMGLSRAFLYAGIPALIVSLWSVNDESTSDLMVRFYRHLREAAAGDAGGTAQALQAAMLETRKDFPHPYHWAPFILLGDWR